MNFRFSSPSARGRSFLRKAVPTLALAVSLASQGATAQTITGPSTATQQSEGTTVDLGTVTAYAYYPSKSGGVITDPKNAGAFTAATGSNGNGQSTFVTFTYKTASGETKAAAGFNYTYGTLSTSSTLFAANEIFNLYYAAFQGSITITATLKSAAGVEKGRYSQTFDAFNSEGNSAGLVTVNVKGGTIGDLVVFGITRGNGTGNVGLEGITATTASAH